MTQVAVDLYVGIKFNISESKAEIQTNVKHEKVQEFLSEYVLNAIHAPFRGEEKLSMKKNEYEIKIGLVISEDEWIANSDCENNNLRDGIVMQLVGMFDDHPEKITWAS